MTQYTLPKSIVHRLVDYWGGDSIYNLRKFAEMNGMDWDSIVDEKDPTSDRFSA